MNKVPIILAVFLLIMMGCSNSNQPKTIAIQTFNGFPKELTDTIQQSIENYYHFNTVTYPGIKIPKEFYSTIKTPRYRADSIIRFLKQNKPDSIDHIIGLTTKDISTTKHDNNGNVKSPISKYKDWGIFGLGYRPGASCVVSTKRLKHPNKAIFINRLKKVTLHELGHNLGLPHCKNKHCFMRDAAETIKTIDEVELNLCKKCFNKVQ